MHYKGRLIASHAGAIDGMLSEMVVVPYEELGIVLPTNTDGVRNLGGALVLHILDRYLGGAQADWNTPLLKSGMRMRSVLFGTPPRTPGTKPALPLSAYAGTYEGPYGRVRVALDRDRLILRCAGEAVPLEH